MRSNLILGALPAALCQTFVPSPGNFPKTGDDTIAGGIFSISLTDLAPYLGSGPGSGIESPKGSGAITTGSGPYPAAPVTDSSLPGHTIYAPKTPPANLSMPFLSWANGDCATSSQPYRNFLTEIASHGYIIAADGGLTGGTVGFGGAQSKVSDSRDSIDWAMKGGAAKYGTIDTTKIASAGQSCGGLEAMSVAYHDDRVKFIIMFNIGIFQDNRRYLLSDIKVPVAYFLGGNKDLGYAGATKDYAALHSKLPTFKANLDTGHSGTYAATNGGKAGKAAVEYLNWQFRGNATAKAICLDPKSSGSLVSDNWSVEFKNWS